MFDKCDISAMRRAISLAQKGIGLTTPNPPVGAVIYRGDTILGTGWHKKAGFPHAEIEAIRDAKQRGHKLRGSSIAITLEPCCTHGKTPPCTEALIREKFARVVIGCLDPDPRHCGRAIPILEKNGITLIEGVLRDQCLWTIRAFSTYTTQQRPWVVAKLAISLDSRITPAPGLSRILSAKEAHKFAHKLRLQSDAVLVGATTVRSDDPALTIRHVPKPSYKPQPFRIILSRSGKIPPGSRLLTDEHSHATQIIRRSSWPQILKKLANQGVQNLLIEGGGRTIVGALEAGVVDELHLIICPTILGSNQQAFPFKKWLKPPLSAKLLPPQKLGPDILISAILNKQFSKTNS